MRAQRGPEVGWDGPIFINPGGKCAAASVLQAVYATRAGRTAIAACPELCALAVEAERKSHAVDPTPLWGLIGLGDAQASAEEVLQLAAQRIGALGQALRVQTVTTTCCTGCGLVTEEAAPKYVLAVSVYRDSKPAAPRSLQLALREAEVSKGPDCLSCGASRTAAEAVGGGQPPVLLAVATNRAVHAPGEEGGCLLRWDIEISKEVIVAGDRYALRSVVVTKISTSP